MRGGLVVRVDGRRVVWVEVRGAGALVGGRWWLVLLLNRTGGAGGGSRVERALAHLEIHDETLLARHVRGVGARVGESLAAIEALEGLLAAVDADVLLQVVLELEGLAALLALETTQDLVIELLLVADAELGGAHFEWRRAVGLQRLVVVVVVIRARRHLDPVAAQRLAAGRREEAAGRLVIGAHSVAGGRRGLVARVARGGRLRHRQHQRVPQILGLAFELVGGRRAHRHPNGGVGVPRCRVGRRCRLLVVALVELQPVGGHGRRVRCGRGWS